MTVLACGVAGVANFDSVTSMWVNSNKCLFVDYSAGGIPAGCVKS